MVNKNALSINFLLLILSLLLMENFYILVNSQEILYKTGSLSLPYPLLYNIVWPLTKNFFC